MIAAPVTNPISVLIIDGEPWLSLLVARCLARVPNLRVHVLAEAPWAPLRFSRHQHTYRVARFRHDTARRLEMIHDTARRTGTDVIMPVTEEAIRFATANATELQRTAAIAPLPSLEALTDTTHKWAFAQLAERHQLPIAATIRYAGDDISELAVQSLDSPVLVKPTSGEGGRGIRLFERPGDAIDFLRQLPEDQTAEYIVQTFIPGRDVDCSVLCQDGRILAHTIQQPTLSGTRDFKPSSAIEFIADNEVLALARRWAAVTNWSGVAHIDMRRGDGDGRLHLLEVNARYWTSLLGSLTMGVNFPHLAGLTALGIPFPTPTYRHGPYADFGTTLRRVVRHPTVWRAEPSPRFGATSLRYSVADPLAGLVQLGRQAHLVALRSFRLRGQAS